MSTTRRAGHQQRLQHLLVPVWRWRRLSGADTEVRVNVSSRPLDGRFLVSGATMIGAPRSVSRSQKPGTGAFLWLANREPQLQQTTVKKYQ